MARYPATREGMFGLLGLAQDLRNVKEDICNQGDILVSRCGCDAEGIYEQIIETCCGITSSAYGTSASIEIIAKQLCRLAEAIADILPLDTTDGPSGSSQSSQSGLATFLSRLSEIGANNLYKHIIAGRLDSLPPALARLFGKYGHLCRISRIDVEEKAACYSPASDSVFLNQSADTTNPLGMGNTHFHEGGHQIDFIAGRINGRDSPYSFQRGMADAVLSDYEHAISGHMSEAGCSEGEAQKWLTREIRRAGNAANCVSDVFGGASDGMVRGPWEHDGDYFRVACGKERLASEAFAEITADYACGNTEHIAFTKRFMPRTLALYHQIIGELVS